MKCPHCNVTIHDEWTVNNLWHKGVPLVPDVRTTVCPACARASLQLKMSTNTDWHYIWPRAPSRGFTPVDVPEALSKDYLEACAVLEISPMASAAISRRCLQNVLNHQGYKGKDLSKQIDALLSEGDASKAVSLSLRETVDAIRNFGNFSAHPINDQTTLQIIDVEPEEAGWCLEIIEEMFEHFYTKPAATARRKLSLNTKLSAAGKPPAK